MMISPEGYYEENLKGKTAAEIMTAIRGLKQEIGRLKNIIEHPNYTCTMHPSEETRLWCTRLYLERAKEALAEVGGTYVPSKAEEKVADFDANIPFISKVEFCIGGFFDGFETRTYTIDGKQVHIDVEHSLILKPSNLGDIEIEEMDAEDFFAELAELHIGEWRKNYDPKRWGYAVLDGTQWHLYIYYSNGRKAVKIEGSNDYPYNFGKLQELFGIDPWADEEENDEQE
mgnify:CR=1 FL=1